MSRRARVPRPNVVLILTDDQGYGDLGVYGNPAVHTPHLDALARQGVRLDQHYSGAPLCAPARAALLTGRYHQRTGALSVESNRGMDRIAPREATVADLFKTAGYATGMVGKWHNGAFDPRHHPQARGFDEFVGFLNGGMYYWRWTLDRGGTPWRSDGRYLTDVFTDEAVAFLQRHRAEPFFLYLAYNAPHAPLEAPPEDVRPFAEHGGLSATVRTLYGMIRRLDAGIGRVLEALDVLGLAENTIVLFTSDNGPLLGGDYRRYNGPFRGAKNLVLEGGIRVPAMVRWPARLPAGRVFRGMAHFTDWLPTLLAACGVDERPELPLDGVDLLPVLAGEVTDAPRHTLYWQHNRSRPLRNCNAAMRDGEWKLVWPYPPEARYKSDEDRRWYERMFTEPHFTAPIAQYMLERPVPQPERPRLFNLADDPGEEVDLSERHPARRARMQRDLERWFDAVEAERRRIAW